MFLKILLIVSIGVVSSEYVDYRNHKVYKVVPRAEDIEHLVNLKKSNEYSFWTEADIAVGRDIRIQVAPQKQLQFEKYALDTGIKAERTVEDVQRLIDEQRQRPANQGRNIREYAWDYYQTLDEIYEWMDATAAAYPNVASVVTIGQTVNGRPIRGMVIDYGKRENASTGFMEGGLHAREWITAATLTWVIKEFLTSNDPGVRAMAEDIQWHIFPVTNPDGYVYSFTDNRMWRKNRNTAYATSCAHLNQPDDMSNGVDLNRNFDFLWMIIGASSDPCTIIYAGPTPFSEVEAVAMSNYMNTLKSRGNFLYYLGYHSYTQLLLIPFSHTSGGEVLQTNNYGDLFEIGIKAMDKLKERHNTSYIVGTAGDTLGKVTGAAFDWAKGVANVPITLLFELRDQGEYGFLLPPRYIIPNNEEVVDGLAEIHRLVRALGYYRSGASSYQNSFLFVILSIFGIFALS